MASVDNAYSRLVFWLKLALPLAALAILSTLFLIAERLDPEAAIPFAEVDVDRLLREQGVSSPRFGGVTPNGAEIVLSAQSIRPVEEGDGLLGVELSSDIALPSGTSITIGSPEGVINFSAESAVLRGGATLESSLGYVVKTPEISSRYDIVEVSAKNGVVATGPGGEISAGAMSLSQEQQADGYLLVFHDGVRLIYEPQE